MSFYEHALTLRERRQADTVLSKTPAHPQMPNRPVEKLVETIESIYNIKELDSLLEAVLTEARRFVSADAGTLYLKVEDRLYFSFVQNESLFTGGKAKNKYLYSQESLIANKDSLAGYVATTGESLLIDDVYHIKSSVSFSFNPAYDYKTQYKTQSMLIVPLKTRDDTTVGVLQLINAKSASGEVIPFSEQDRIFILQFARSAANTIEQARLSQEMVLRMVELAELRDPFETSNHAKRVGAYCVELYDRWGRKHGLNDHEIRNTKEILRTAAMLHDVGKVAISDLILKKPGELTDTETRAMRMHTIFGARLFKQTRSTWDRLAQEVVLNHHERWDGKGYPGRIDDIFSSDIQFGPGKVGTEIPIAARIVSLADVYDALVSERAYKEAWETDFVHDYIQNQKAKQFDPELVDLFLAIRDVIGQIHDKYSY